MMLQKIRFGRAPVVFGAILLFLVVLWFARPTQQVPDGFTPTSAEQVAAAYGIQKPAASAVLAALPELKTQPMLLEFRTQMCLDCQALAPVLDKLAQQNPDVTLLVYDLDKTRKLRPAIFDLFQPVTVPTLIALNQQGQVKQVLYERPDETTLTQVFQQLKQGK
jgi:thiol:disulfide interchange protein